MKPMIATTTDDLSARLDGDIVARLDALAPLVAPIGSKPTRTMAIRACIIVGLGVLEKRFAKETT